MTAASSENIPDFQTPRVVKIWTPRKTSEELETAVDEIRGRGRQVGGDSYIYSCLKTVLGSTCDARRAGIYAPSAVIARRASMTGATRGQLKWRPPGMAAVSLPAVKLSSRPIAIPLLASAIPCFSTILIMADRSAPIAIRIPISRYRKLTE